MPMNMRTPTLVIEGSSPCKPFTTASANADVRKGSSPNVSLPRPQRGSLKRLMWGVQQVRYLQAAAVWEFLALLLVVVVAAQRGKMAVFVCGVRSGPAPWF
jgi:hypothetical protein